MFMINIYTCCVLLAVKHFIITYVTDMTVNIGLFYEFVSFKWKRKYAGFELELQFDLFMCAKEKIISFLFPI